MQARGKMQSEDCKLQTRGKMREKTAGNTSALVEVRRNIFLKIYLIWSKCLTFFRILIGKFFTN